MLCRCVAVHHRDVLRVFLEEIASMYPITKIDVKSEMSIVCARTRPPRFNHETTLGTCLHSKTFPDAFSAPKPLKVIGEQQDLSRKLVRQPANQLLGWSMSSPESVRPSATLCSLHIVAA
ncbi:hypothetical protein ANCDUO_05103 [Ancylostoma duodenale]|uniref:Uncharacterized protein n=1 Tax=Ancylostoma duodenale TaxID=51022 RepID=A0A0C2GZD2_9BILA|nr:hypothetical protein ANCDUO_05103 [Ancylostoma duodenale]